MPVEFTNPAYIAPSCSAKPALLVANQAARLALIAATIAGVVIVQEDDNSAYLLVEGGTPSNVNDWISLASGGASAWSSLTDRTSAPLATENTGLANALAGKAPVAAPAFTGTAVFEGLTEGVANLGNSTGTRTLSIATATSLETTLTGNCAFTLPSATPGKSFVLDILTGAGGFTPTFTGVTWAGGVTPAFPTTASERITLGFRTNAAGTVWLGSMAGSGGATTYAALTDAATVDLPTINGPLAAALAGKAEQSALASYQPLIGTGTLPLAKLATDPLARGNHTGTQSADTLTAGTANKVFLAADQAKLAAISGTNTGDQTNIAGNAETATALTAGSKTITGTLTAAGFIGKGNGITADTFGDNLDVFGNTVGRYFDSNGYANTAAKPADSFNTFFHSAGFNTGVSINADIITAAGFVGPLTGNALSSNGLKTATTTVAVDGATAPTSGQVLTATSGTVATWQTPSGGAALALTAPPSEAVAASSNISVTGGLPPPGATLTIAGRVYTWRNSITGPNEILIGTIPANAVDGVYTALNNPAFGTTNADVRTTSAGSNFITIEARVDGTSGNGITVLSSVSQIVVSSLSGGSNGTVATTIGQRAIVTTTNASGTFRDAWTAVAIAPVSIWTPPGNIKKDRSNGLLYREYYSGGLPATELAYP